MPAATGVHPTMWVRLWFDNAGKPHQRAYTLVDPDPETGTFALEFALHEGAPATGHGRRRPGTRSRRPCRARASHTRTPPRPMSTWSAPRLLPAVNSLLGALGDAPATIWFEGSLDGLPFAGAPARHRVREAPRRDAGAALVNRVRAELPDLLRTSADPYVWIACDTATTRALGAFVRKQLGLPKQRVQALGYWRAS